MLLIFRKEIACLIILAFLTFYYLMNKGKGKYFLRITSFAIMHVVFEIITIATANGREYIPDFMNRIVHIIFYIAGILFMKELYNHAVYLSISHKYMHLFKNAGHLPVLLFGIAIMFLDVEYVQVNGMWYAHGLLGDIAYAIFTLYISGCLLILLVSGRNLEEKVKHTLIPVMAAMVCFVIIQAVFPELLMTGATVTIICLSIFVILDNPDKDYMEQALWDSTTGLKNRNCYSKDYAEYVQRYQKKGYYIGIVVADLNYLKAVNDRYGHAEGDRLIVSAAKILESCLHSAENIYRFGGDEFIALYISPEEHVVASEMRMVKQACENNRDHKVPLCIAMGYASGIIDSNMDEIFHKADVLMYEDKEKEKKNNTHF